MQYIQLPCQITALQLAVLTVERITLSLSVVIYRNPSIGKPSHTQGTIVPYLSFLLLIVLAVDLKDNNLRTRFQFKKKHIYSQ